MKRQAFLLGLFSIGGQVFLLRELVAAFNGDELFIGTALFGWLLAVAIGAFISGRERFLSDARVLFVVGAILLPASIIAVRLSPSMITDFLGEVVPFAMAGMISILAMFPVGVVSGMIFTVISRYGRRASDSVASVYLFEGFGAFVGGLAVTFSTGGPVSSIMLAAFLGVVSAAGAYIDGGSKRSIFSGIIGATSIILTFLFFSPVENHVDEGIYAPYTVRESFDSHYGRHAILERESNLIFITDNAIEAVYPDPETNENLLLPPLVYFPEARNILFVGRAELGLGELCDKYELNLTTIDPRSELNDILQGNFSPANASDYIDNDPVKYFSRENLIHFYDVIILGTGEPDSYFDSRYYTERFLVTIRNWLGDDGILFLPTKYDTDRHIDRDKKHALSVVYKTLGNVFSEIAYWPGQMTHFFASSQRKLDLPSDSIMARVEKLKGSPQYIHPNYLIDRLQPLKIERLSTALNDYDEINSLQRPILLHIQTLMNSRLDSFDRKLIGFVLGQSWWLIVLPVGILAFLVRLTFGRGRRENFALFLYFIAGLVSLSLELICFYLYQSIAGSLYSEMAILIGAFMLGLAVGTYYAMRVGERPVEFPALIMLAVATIIFIASYNSIGIDAVLAYYSLFLFVTALATGTLFVGATNRYYMIRLRANRGAGYAWELVGSSIGALLTTTVLLPIIGLTWLLWSLVILIALTFAGGMLNNR